MTSKVTVYSKPSCVQCTAVIRSLSAKGIEHDYVDVSEDAEAYKFVTETLNYRQVPVVTFGDDFHFSGMMPNKVTELETLYHAGKAMSAQAEADAEAAELTDGAGATEDEPEADSTRPEL